MGLAVVVPGANFIKNAIRYDVAVTAGLVGLYLPLGDIEDIARNFAPAGVSGTISGAPVKLAGGGVRFPGTGSYVDTGLSETAELTVMVAGKSPDGLTTASTRPQYAGTYGSTNADGLASGNSGFNLSATSATSLIMNASHFNDAAHTTLTGGNRTLAVPSGYHSDWNISLMRVNDVTARLQALKLGLESLGTTYPYPRTLSTGKIRIGGGFSSSGNADIGAIAIYNRVLSDAEIAQMYAQFKSLLEPILGVTL